MKKNIKHFKKWLALLLAVVLVGGICVVTRGGSLRATEGEPAEENAEEAVSDTPEEEAPTEIVVSEEVKEDGSVNEPETQMEDETESTVPEAEKKAEGEEETKEEEAVSPETEEVTEEAEETKKEEVERSVEITSSLGSTGTVEEGTPLTLTAHLTGFDDVEYEIQWQQSEDGTNWDNIDGENGIEYTVILTEDNTGCLWRASVSTLES